VYLVDYHLHSSCSVDGEFSIERMAAAAVERGLREICVTDHLDTVYWDTLAPRTYFDWPEALRQLEEARNRWGDRLSIRLGAEIGEAVMSFERADQMLEKAPPLDFSVGSVHFTGARFDHLDLYYMPAADETYYNELLSDYLDNVLAISRWGRFQVLGHLTLPLRYIRKNAGLDMDFSGHMDRVEEIFRCIISKGIGIECNTNRGYTDTLPGRDILELYHRMGGEIVTIGSDAHAPAHVGYRIREGQQLLQSCGFRYFTTFVQGKPVFRPLLEEA